MCGKLYKIIIIGFLLSGLLSACNLALQEPDQITIQFSWFHTTEFAGFYAADQKGFYTEENLKVTFVPGGPEVDPLGEVLAGRAQFGVTTGDSIIRAHITDQDVVAIASIFQQSPLVVMTLPEYNIRNPQDLVGKTVGVISPALDTTWDIQFLAMLDRLGIDRSSMTFVPIEDYHGANELTSGRMEAASGFFSTNEPVQAELDGYKPVSLFLSDYGVVMYVNPIFTSGQLIREQPELVERFIRATLKGYQYAIENPEEAAQFSLVYDDTLDIELQTATMRVEIPLIDTGEVPIGWMIREIWENTEDVLVEQNIISSRVDLNAIYTNEFIEKAQ